jgi:hypothetical protein
MNNRPLRVLRESETGRDILYGDLNTYEEYTLPELVQRIEAGLYPNYHLRVINDIQTPVSNPNKIVADNIDGYEYEKIPKMDIDAWEKGKKTF